MAHKPAARTVIGAARCSASSCISTYTPVPVLRASPMSARSRRFLSPCRGG